jgi:hypothetical protein
VAHDQDPKRMNERGSEETRSKLVRMFTPFSDEELGVFRRYVERCDRMRDSRLGKLRRLEVNVIPAPEFATELNLQEEDFGGFLMPFRQLYLTKDETEFGKVRNLLSRHAHDKGTETSGQVVEYLKRQKNGYHSVLRESPMGTIFDADPSTTASFEHTPRDIIDNWLNGVFFHPEADAAREVEGPDRALSAFFLADAVLNVAAYMFRLGELARVVLREPALHAG